MTCCDIPALKEYDFPPGRDSRLPTMYMVENHPLHPSTNPGRTFLVKIRPTIAAMEATEQFERLLETPKGTKKDLDAQGLLEMEGGDYLFGRNELGTGKAEDDVIIAWSVPASLQTDEDKAALDDATKTALGGRAGRTRKAVHMEKFFKPVKPNTRCFGVASSLERQPTIVAPGAHLKEPSHAEEVREIASKLASSVAPMAMKNMYQAPRNVQDAIRLRSEMIGVPRLGSASNWAYQALQANIASVPEDSSGDLSEQMGFFGEAHFDDGDSAGHYTNMITNSDLPEGYDAGYFHLLAFGVYVRLQNYGGFNFQGNRKHGGTGPFPPPGQTPPPHAYRFNCVSYLPANMMNPTRTRWRVATDPGIPAYITPEMRDPEFHAPLASATGNESATFFKHGHIYMDRQSQAEFYSRGLYDMCRYYANQVPGEVGFTIDPEKFLQAFAYQREDGVARGVPSWSMAPRVEVDEPLASVVKKHYADSRRVWEAHYQKTAGLIPSRFLRSEELRHAVAFRESAGDARPTLNEGLGQIEDDAGIGRDITPARQGRTVGEPSRMHAGTTSGPAPRKRRGSPEIENAAAPRKRAKTASGSGVGKPSANARGASSQMRQPMDASQRGEFPASGSATTGCRAVGKDRGSEKGKAKAAREPADDGAFKFAFTRGTTVEVLEAELYQLLREVRAQESTETQPPLAAVTQSVSETVDAVANCPEARTASQDIATLVDKIDTIESIHDRQGHDVRRSRDAAINARTRIWLWVTEDVNRIATQVQTRNRGPRCEETWIEALVDAVREVFQKQKEMVVFDSSHYTFHPAETGVRFLYRNAMREKPLSGEELRNATSRAVSDIVSGWLRYEKEAKMKQVWFISALREALGVEIMTMDFAWRMIRNFKSTYVSSGSHPSRTTNPESTLPFKEELSRHPICQENSREYELYRQYRLLYRGEINASEVTTLLGTGPGWAKYVTMWRTSLAYVRSPAAEPQSDYHQRLREEPDFYLPIREKAPCRVRATSQDGMYRADVIKTLSGIFSAVVFRAITYRTPFFLNHNPLFDGWADFTSTIDRILQGPGFEGMGRNDEYFSLLGPYGQPNPQRNVDLAQVYYRSLEERGWSQFCGGPRTFAQVMRYFTPRKGEKVIFPQLGDLARLGLVCDLAYANVCSMPTIRDIAECMVTTGSGGMKGLRILRVLDPFPNKTPKEQKIRAVEDALQRVMDFLQSKFSAEERREMGLDLVVLEHSLCKLSRAEKVL